MVRSILLVVRAIDRTGRAFGSAEKNLTNIQRLQRDMRRRASALLFTGAALALIAMKASQGMLGLMERTRQGTFVIDDMKRAWGGLLDRVGESVTDKVTPILRDITKYLDKLASMPKTIDILVTVGIALTIGAVGLALLALGGTIGGFIASLLPASVLTALGMSAGKIAPNALETFAGFGAPTSTAAGGVIIPLALTVAAAIGIRWSVSHFFEGFEEDSFGGILGRVWEYAINPAQAGMDLKEWINERDSNVDSSSLGDSGFSSMFGLSEIIVNMYDTMVNADDPDDVGEKVAGPVGNKIIDIFGDIR